jgi:hypothetical protein
LSTYRNNSLTPSEVFNLDVAYPGAGQVNGSLRWFSLENPAAEPDDLLAMGQTRAALQDANSDGVVDERDAQLDSIPSDLVLYKRNATAGSWSAQRLVSDVINVNATATSADQSQLSLNGSLQLLAGGGTSQTPPQLTGVRTSARLWPPSAA